MRRTLTALSVAALLLAIALAGPARAAAKVPAAVTWDGWRAAQLGANIHHAAKSLHKPLYWGCKPLLYMRKLPAGMGITNGIHDGKAIDQITVYDWNTRAGVITAPKVTGPEAIHIGERLKDLRAALKADGLRLHNRWNTEARSKGDYWVQGTDGHVLWFRLDRYTGNVEGTMTEHKSQVSIFSLVSTKADAFTAMQYEGGC